MEIHDVAVNRSLPQEGISQHFASLQLVPEQYFSQRAVLPQFPRSFFQSRVVVKHRCEIPTWDIPLPPFKGGIALGNLEIPRFKGNRAWHHRKFSTNIRSLPNSSICVYRRDWPSG